MASSPLVATKVGALACQRDPFLRTLKATVVSCDATAAAAVSSAKKTSASAVAAATEQPTMFELIATDSVLFPEGGGQPWDLGTVNGVQVSSVTRRGDTCVIHIPQAFAVGSEIEMAVDWPRRVDHMTHHTAQHLVTAVVERELGLPTESWSLTSPYCFIQVPTAKIDDADVAKCEAIINDYIARGCRVECQMFASREDLPPARSRKIPADVTGPIRVIDIAEVDSCTCCGTHLTNLSQIQAVKLLHQEAKGSTCRLFFAAGQRVLANFGDMYFREKALMKELGTAPQNIVSFVARRGQEASDGAKSVKKLLTEIAALVAPSIAKEAAALQPNEATYFYLREDGDMEFLAAIAAALASGAPQRTCVLACGSLKEADSGAFFIVGPNTTAVSAAFLPLVAGKGGQTKQGFRGKCDMRKWKAALKAMAPPPPPTAAAASA